MFLSAKPFDRFSFKNAQRALTIIYHRGVCISRVLQNNFSDDVSSLFTGISVIKVFELSEANFFDNIDNNT